MLLKLSATLVLATVLANPAATIKLFVKSSPWERSARWDNYIESLTRGADPHRVERSSETSAPANTPCGWQHSSSECSGMNFYEADRWQRRSPNSDPSRSLLAPPQNQGFCGNCWAFATVNAITDQLSISDGRRAPLLSSQYLTTCLTNDSYVGDGNGCCGGKIQAGAKFISKYGTVDATCVPYTLQDVGDKSNLSACPNRCSNTGSTFRTSTYMLASYTSLKSDDQIMTALDGGFMVGVFMNVSDEFKSVYRCGIYCESENSKMTRSPREEIPHAVVIVDYGTYNNIPFWVVKNSWGGNHHENGYFRIKRGELNIGKNGYAIKYIFDRTTSSSNFQGNNGMSCAAESMSAPKNDSLVMSAVDMLLNLLVKRSQVPPCSNGTAVTHLDLGNIMKATIQNVAGTIIELSLSASTNCREGGHNVKAMINATVILALNGTFKLDDFDYSIIAPTTSGGEVVTINMWLATVVSVLLACKQIVG